MSWFRDLIDRWRKRPPKPTLPPVTPPTPIPEPQPVDATVAEKALLDAGRQLGVRSLVEGQPHDLLLREARAYAERMAANNRQDDHAGFSERFARITRELPGFKVNEITAESWDHEVTPDAGALSMFNAWRQSSGHWAAANGPARFIGYSMARGKSRWFACGIIVR